ncbi:IS5 family transposase [Corynebacterium phoceense]|uniref:IS5 family transposase n=1 Tax=Corynebacterium phoceense TaxID=1686286 RepID=UPI0035238B9D
MTGTNYAETARAIMETIVYRFSVGCPRRDLPDRFGPWQTVWKRHNLYSHTGVYDAIYQRVMALKDAEANIDWGLSVDGTMSRAHQRATKTPRLDQDTGARTQYKNSSTLCDEPAVHTGGRTRGGLATKARSGVTGNRRAMVIIVTGEQSHDSEVLPNVFEGLRVPQLSGAGRPRVRPNVVIADRAYPSATYRDHCRRRGIKFVSPERKDQVNNRKRTGAKDGRPPKRDANRYKDRNIVERFISRAKQQRGLATRCQNMPSTIEAAWSYLPCLTGLNPMKRHDLGSRDKNSARRDPFLVRMVDKAYSQHKSMNAGAGQYLRADQTSLPTHYVSRLTHYVSRLKRNSPQPNSDP